MSEMRAIICRIGHRNATNSALLEYLHITFRFLTVYIWYSLLHRKHGTGCWRSWNCCDRRTRFVVIWKHFSFCLQTPGYGLTLWCALGLLVGAQYKCLSYSQCIFYVLIAECWMLNAMFGCSTCTQWLWWTSERQHVVWTLPYAVLSDCPSPTDIKCSAFALALKDWSRTMWVCRIVCF